jgi:hypothetical protein
MDLRTITAFVTLAGAIVALVSNAFGVLDKIAATLRWLANRFRPHETDFKIPTRTVVLIPEARINALIWTEGKSGDKPAMQVMGDFVITNLTAAELHLPVGLLRFRRGMFRQVHQCNPALHVQWRGFDGGIPPRATVGARLVFRFVIPEPREQPKELVADVAIVDQFNNHHWLRPLRFKHPSRLQQ